ncbi:MFS transporter, partial [Streptomyces sp. NPDC005921]
MCVFPVHDPFQRGRLAIAALFCSLGFQYATWAARIPAIKADLGLTAAEVGVLLMAAGIGAVASFPLVPVLMRRLGSARLALLSALCLALLLPALALAPDYPVALLVMVADGVCVGCLNVAMNAQGTVLETRYERTTMAKLHATFSAGSLLAALLASGMNAATSSVTAHFGVAAAVLVLLAAVARTGLLVDEAPAAEKQSRSRTGWSLPSRVTLWMCCAMAFGTVTEGAMNDWSALYLREVATGAVFGSMEVVTIAYADAQGHRSAAGAVLA